MVCTSLPPGLPDAKAHCRNAGGKLSLARMHPRLDSTPALSTRFDILSLSTCLKLGEVSRTSPITWAIGISGTPAGMLRSPIHCEIRLFESLHSTVEW